MNENDQGESEKVEGGGKKIKNKITQIREEQTEKRNSEETRTRKTGVIEIKGNNKGVGWASE